MQVTIGKAADGSALLRLPISDAVALVAAAHAFWEAAGDDTGRSEIQRKVAHDLRLAILPTLRKLQSLHKSRV